MIQNVIDFVKDNWVGIGVIYVAFVQLLKAIRDAIDKTPSTDDNCFERLVTILGKVGASLLTGKTPK